MLLKTKMRYLLECSKIREKWFDFTVVQDCSTKKRPTTTLKKPTQIDYLRLRIVPCDSVQLSHCKIWVHLCLTIVCILETKKKVPFFQCKRTRKGRSVFTNCPVKKRLLCFNKEAMKTSFQWAFCNKVSFYSSLSKMTMKDRMLPIPRARHLNCKWYSLEDASNIERTWMCLTCYSL